jgi:hypothetical protein
MFVYFTFVYSILNLIYLKQLILLKNDLTFGLWFKISENKKMTFLSYFLGETTIIEKETTEPTLEKIGWGWSEWSDWYSR